MTSTRNTSLMIPRRTFCFKTSTCLNCARRSANSTSSSSMERANSPFRTTVSHTSCLVAHIIWLRFLIRTSLCVSCCRRHPYPSVSAATSPSCLLRCSSTIQSRFSLTIQICWTTNLVSALES